MQEVYVDIPRLYSAFAQWASASLCFLLLPKRMSFLKSAALSFLFLCIQVAFMVSTGKIALVFWIPCMILSIVLIYAYLYIGIDFRKPEAVYCTALVFLFAEFAASLEWQLHVYFFENMTDSEWAKHGIALLCFGLIFCFAYFTLKTMLTGDALRRLRYKDVISVVGIVTFVFAFSNLSFILNGSPFSAQVVSDIYLIRTIIDFGGIAVVYAFHSRINEYVAESERALLNSMLKSQYEQYRGYQESIDLVHIKYHDLKHQIAGLRAENNTEKRMEWLDRMEEELNFDEISLNTNNHVLDTILKIKMMYAKQNQIQMTCVADGSRLSHLHVTDICSIFGNALDNALEHVILIPNPAMRMIHLTVSTKKNFLIIEISNYTETGSAPANGEWVTTKTDKKNHGFGLKSIRYAVEKYKGTMQIRLRQHWYELKILIPL